jgi:hypothetical protein
VCVCVFNTAWCFVLQDGYDSGTTSILKVPNYAPGRCLMSAGCMHTANSMLCSAVGISSQNLHPRGHVQTFRSSASSVVRVLSAYLPAVSHMVCHVRC